MHNVICLSFVLKSTLLFSMQEDVVKGDEKEILDTTVSNNKEGVKVKWQLMDPVHLDIWNKWYTHNPFKEPNSLTLDNLRAALESDSNLLCYSLENNKNADLPMDPMSEFKWSIFSEDISFLLIINLAKIKDVVNFGRTCKDINTTCSSDQVWKYLFSIRFPNAALGERKNWKDIYSQVEANNLKVLLLNFQELDRKIESEDKNYAYCTWNISYGHCDKLDLSKSCFDHATIKADKQKVVPRFSIDFSDASLQHSTMLLMPQSNFKKPSFRRAKLCFSKIIGPMKYADFQGADLSHATIYAAALVGACLDNSTKIEKLTIIITGENGNLEEHQDVTREFLLSNTDIIYLSDQSGDNKYMDVEEFEDMYIMMKTNNTLWAGGLLNDPQDDFRSWETSSSES